MLANLSRRRPTPDREQVPDLASIVGGASGGPPMRSTAPSMGVADTSPERCAHAMAGFDDDHSYMPGRLDARSAGRPRPACGE